MTAADREWLEVVRRLRPELSQADFEALIPEFLRMKRELMATKRRGVAS